MILMPNRIIYSVILIQYRITLKRKRSS